MRVIVPFMMLLAVVSGCARFGGTQPAAAPGEPTTRTVENARVPCQQAGGTWNAKTAQCDNLP